mmetsp:Transcript_134273/g.258436  ORF Transcript_134273/g.258436 Transcript_134273/m.258436 type:complete len:154 (+) Transcript_134273:743-1204(+)
MAAEAHATIEVGIATGTAHVLLTNVSATECKTVTENVTETVTRIKSELEVGTGTGTRTEVESAVVGVKAVKGGSISLITREIGIKTASGLEAVIGIDLTRETVIKTASTPEVVTGIDHRVTGVQKNVRADVQFMGLPGTARLHAKLHRVRAQD